jgi:hypothetical protein
MRRTPFLLMLAALSSPAVLTAQEELRSGQQATLQARVIEIYDLVGNVTMRRGTGGGVTIRPTSQGADGGRLRYFVDRASDRAVFRVQFPDVDEIAAPAGQRGWGGRTTVHVRPDGTFGGDDGDWPRRSRRTVDIGRSGLRASADLEISVPEGATVRLHLAAGAARIEGVNGNVVVDTWSASADATNIAGDWLFDTGSGDVEVRGMQGVLSIDTGSGSGIVTGMRGDVLSVDTGSGAVEVSDAQVTRCNFDTGSGDVRATGLTARRCVADTGSGSVRLDFAGGTLEDLVIDTGAGGVTLTLPPDPDVRVTVDVGSGGINVMREGGMLEHRSRTELGMRFGEGRGRVRIDTGSGGVTIR